MDNDLLAPTRFDTDALPEATRMETVRAFYADISMAVDLQPLVEPRDFRLDLAALNLDAGCGLGGGLLSPYVGRRNRVQADRHGAEGILLTRFTVPFTFSGGALERECFTPGDVLVAPLDQAYTYIYEHPGRIQTLWMDRRRLRELLPGLDPSPRRLRAATPGLGLLFGYARALEADTLPRSLVAATTRHLIELAAQALGAGGAVVHDSGEGRHAALLAQLRADIVRDCCDPALSVAVLALRHRVSVRLVQQVFEHAGTTFTEALQTCRLAHAQRLLRDPLRAHLKIAAIAYDAGFSDLAAFNRLFRRRVGATPTDVRRQAQQAAG